MGADDIDRSSRAARDWVDEAVRRVEADANRSADTHLVQFPLPGRPHVDLYLKDESTHPTGSLKHRLARSLFLYALCNGQIAEGTTVIEASSGSTAVSEAYFARMLGLPFVAVMPASTSAEKIALIEREGGKCQLVDDATTVYAEASRLAAETNGTISTSSPTPSEPPTGAATTTSPSRSSRRWRWSVFRSRPGSSSAPGPAAPARRSAATCVIAGTRRGSPSSIPNTRRSSPAGATTTPSADGRPSRIEGIGRPRVEPSFVPGVVDRMIAVPDAASIATARAVEPILGRRVGPSTGTNLWGALRIARELDVEGASGSIVTLLCDGGERYANTYYDDGWLADQDIDISPYETVLRHLLN